MTVFRVVILAVTLAALGACGPTLRDGGIGGTGQATLHWDDVHQN